MTRSLKTVFAATALAFTLATTASANMRITEWLYSGDGGEFVEFTNVGNAPIDMTGWSYDDDSRTPDIFDLSGFGVVQPGESVVITESVAADFIADWGLVGVKVLGGYTNNLGRNDEINLFDASDALVDRLTYGDQNFPGSIRTADFSGNIYPENLGNNDPFSAVLSSVGDGFGSYSAGSGDVGNPGSYSIPEPASIALIGLAGLALIRRR